MRKITRLIATIIYFGFARYLPESYSPLSLGLTRPFRGILCRLMVNKCGKNVNVERLARFGYNLEIGDNSGIGINAVLHTKGSIYIGKDVLMGPEVMFFTADHIHDGVKIPTRGRGEVTSPIIIEDDVWIGARVIILRGVKIGRSSVIGAGAVVTKDIPPCSIVGGNPARVLKTRDQD